MAPPPPNLCHFTSSDRYAMRTLDWIGAFSNCSASQFQFIRRVGGNGGKSAPLADLAESTRSNSMITVHSSQSSRCTLLRTSPFRIMNFLEIVGASMGLHHDDHFKRLKMMQDVDAILADCRDLVEQHGLDIEATRQAIKAMLDEQPVPLRGATGL